MSDHQAFVLLGFASKRNETGVLQGVTGKPSGLAPQHTQGAGRNRKINGLAAGGESFSGHAITVFTEKTVANTALENVFMGFRWAVDPRKPAPLKPLFLTTGPQLDSRLDCGVHHGVH